MELTLEQVQRKVTQMQDRDDKLCYLEEILCQMEDNNRTKTDLYRTVRSMYKSL
jgi:hypothetical protein